VNVCVSERLRVWVGGYACGPTRENVVAGGDCCTSCVLAKCNTVCVCAGKHQWQSVTGLHLFTCERCSHDPA